MHSTTTTTTTTMITIYSPGCRRGSISVLWRCPCDLSASSAACNCADPTPAEPSPSTRTQSPCHSRSSPNCRSSLCQHSMTKLDKCDNTGLITTTDWHTHSHPHHHNHFMALFPGLPGWASARRELLDFMVQGKMNRGRHTDHPAGRHSIRTSQCPSPPSPHFL